jgi:hypothetical protein
VSAQTARERSVGNPGPARGTSPTNAAAGATALAASAWSVRAPGALVWTLPSWSGRFGRRRALVCHTSVRWFGERSSRCASGFDRERQLGGRSRRDCSLGRARRSRRRLLRDSRLDRDWCRQGPRDRATELFLEPAARHTELLAKANHRNADAATRPFERVRLSVRRAPPDAQHRRCLIQREEVGRASRRRNSGLGQLAHRSRPSAVRRASHITAPVRDSKPRTLATETNLTPTYRARNPPGAAQSVRGSGQLATRCHLNTCLSGRALVTHTHQRTSTAACG